MKNLISIFFLILITSCSSNPFQNSVVAKKNILLSLLCEKEEVGCKKKKTLDGQELFVRTYPSVVLGIQNAQVLKGPKKKNLIFNVKVEPLGIEMLHSFTKSFQGRPAALIFDDRVIFYSTLFAPITEGNLFFMMDLVKDKEKALELCLSLYPKCSRNMKDMNNLKTSTLEVLPFFEPDLIRKYYGKVNQSHFWYSTYSNVEVYSDENLSNIPKTIPNTKVNGGGFYASYFVGIQDYDKSIRKYTYNNKAVKIRNLGWVKRKDLFPGSVLRPVKHIVSEMYSIGILKKCPSTLDYFVNISKQKHPKFNGSALASVLKNYGAFMADSQTSLCAQLGKKQCKDKLKNLNEKLQSIECSDFETAINLTKLKNKDEYQRLNQKCQGKNTHACLILIEYQRYKKNKKQQIKLMKKACNYKSGEACFNLGLSLTENKPKINVKLEGMKFLKKSCDLKFYPGCHQYAFLLFKQKRKKASIKPYEKSCKNHQYQSCSNLGGMYLSQKKYKDAKRVLERACLFNSPTGCYNMACYWALNQDIQTSLLKLKKAFILGLPVDDWVINGDPDLKFIRGTLEFKALIQDFKRKTKAKKKSN